jgi:predicted phosphodiesterase
VTGGGGPGELAVLSDVHGNRWALEAVFDELERRGVRRMVNLGDCLYGPLDPAGTAELLLRREIPTVSGNQDREIVEPPSEGDPPTLDFVRRELKAEHLRWLESLPPTLATADGIFMVHGSPRDDAEYLLFEVTAAGVRPREPREVQDRLPSVGGSLVLCGHDHLQRTLPLPDGRLVVDPGSVGLPAYRDEEPHPHPMEAGSPHARCSLLRRSGETWEVEHLRVGYDWRSAALAAGRNGRPDWARWLETGRAA